MRQGDAVRMGQLMNDSHTSLRDNFEVCNGPLNEMVAAAHAQPGCFGARMTGAGFGGCAIALVSEEAVESFIDTVSRLYEEATGLIPKLYVCYPANGAEVME
jgi:galactokinase